MEQKLTEVIKYKMQEMGKTNVDISNIRFFREDEKQYAFADISYIWRLNAFEKQVSHKDMIFVLIDNEWKSPLFYSA